MILFSLETSDVLIARERSEKLIMRIRLRLKEKQTTCAYVSNILNLTLKITSLVYYYNVKSV